MLVLLVLLLKPNVVPLLISHTTRAVQHTDVERCTCAMHTKEEGRELLGEDGRRKKKDSLLLSFFCCPFFVVRGKKKFWVKPHTPGKILRLSTEMFNLFEVL